MICETVSSDYSTILGKTDRSAATIDR